MADRTFEVNITTAVQAPYAIKKAGYAGEHNATAIQINLPADYIGGFTYSLELMTGAGEAYLYPLVLIDGDDFLYFELSKPSTDKGTLDFQLKITETATGMVVKTRVINLQIIGRDINTYAELADNYVPDATATEDCLNAAVLANEKAGVADAAASGANDAAAAAQAAAMANQEDMLTTLAFENPYGSFTAKNLVQNPNFDINLDTWRHGQNASIALSDNALVVTGDGTGTVTSAYTVFTSSAINASDKVYIRLKVKANTTLCTLFRLYISASSFTQIPIISNPVNGELYTFSVVADISSSVVAGSCGIVLEADYANTADANGATVTWDDIIVENLTTSFGTGKEPTAAEFEQYLIDKNGSITLSTEDEVFSYVIAENTGKVFVKNDTDEMVLSTVDELPLKDKNNLFSDKTIGGALGEIKAELGALDYLLENVTEENEETDIIYPRLLTLDGGLYKFSNDTAFTANAIGKNIFDGTEEVNKYISGGVLTKGSSLHHTTTPIAICPDVQLTVSGSGVNRGYWVFYNAAMERILHTIGVYTVTTPALCAYFRVYFGNSITGEVQIEIGETATDYEDYSSLVIVDNVTESEIVPLSENTSIVFSSTAKFVEYVSKIDSLENSFAELQGIYGVRFKIIVDEVSDYLAPCERIENAEDLNVSDFDSIYPFSEIKRCNIKILTNGTKKICYEDDTGFTLDGTNGDVFVEIPKHYVKRYVSGGYEYRFISGTPKDGFIIDPVFVENGKTLNAVYVSAYEACVESGALRSKTGVFPTTDYTRIEFRNYAKANGDGYGILDLRTLNMLQNLFLVEYPQQSSQKAIGGGWGFMIQPVAGFLRSVVAETGVNRVVVTGLTNTSLQSLFVGAGISCVDQNSPLTVLMTGRTITAVEADTPSAGQTSVYFDGDPVNTTTDWCLGNCAQMTGWADTIATPSGKTVNHGIPEATAKYRNAVRYRYMENLWGNAWHHLDGLNLYNGEAFYAENLSDHESAKITDTYKPVPFTLATQGSNGDVGGVADIHYIKNLTYDGLNPTFALPESYVNQGETSIPADQTTVALGNDALKTNHFGDYYYLKDSSKGYYCGGGFDHYHRCGLFTMRGWISDTGKWFLIGSRMIYKPI